MKKVVKLALLPILGPPAIIFLVVGIGCLWMFEKTRFVFFE